MEALWKNNLMKYNEANDLRNNVMPNAGQEKHEVY